MANYFGVMDVVKTLSPGPSPRERGGGLDGKTPSNVRPIILD
jgi:hypothetical protein